MRIWAAINDTLSVLVWPLLISGLAWAFRKQLRRLIGGIRHINAFGADLKLDQEAVNERYNERATEVVAGDQRQTPLRLRATMIRGSR